MTSSTQDGGPRVVLASVIYVGLAIWFGQHGEVDEEG